MATPKSRPRFIKSISVPTSETLDQGYTVFSVEAVTTTGSLVVKRRYTEFLALHKVVTEGWGDSNLVFPGKHVLKKKTPQLIEQRRKELQEYMSSVMALSKARRHLYLFLGIRNPARPAPQHSKKAPLLRFNPCWVVEPSFLREEALEGEQGGGGGLGAPVAADLVRPRPFCEQVFSRSRSGILEPGTELGSQSGIIEPGTELGSQSGIMEPGTELGSQSGSVEPGTELGSQSSSVEPGTEIGSQSGIMEPGTEIGSQSGIIEPGTELGSQSGIIEPGTELGSQSGIIEPGTELGSQSGSVEPGTELGSQSGIMEPGTEIGSQSGSVEPGTELGSQSSSVEPGTEIGSQSGIMEPGTELGSQSGIIEPGTELGSQSSPLLCKSPDSSLAAAFLSPALVGTGSAVHVTVTAPTGPPSGPVETADRPGSHGDDARVIVLAGKSESTDKMADPEGLGSGQKMHCGNLTSEDVDSSVLRGTTASTGGQRETTPGCLGDADGDLSVSPAEDRSSKVTLCPSAGFDSGTRPQVHPPTPRQAQAEAGSCQQSVIPESSDQPSHRPRDSTAHVQPNAQPNAHTPVSRRSSPPPLSSSLPPSLSSPSLPSSLPSSLSSLSSSFPPPLSLSLSVEKPTHPHPHRHPHSRRTLISSDIVVAGVLMALGHRCVARATAP